MYERMRRLLAALSTDLHEREEPVRLGVLAALAGESVFLLGPPGTGKSLIARRLEQAFRGARSFVYLMGRFSTPDEIFGPLSIKSLRDNDRYERVTANYLPEADVVFLDEIWKASPPIQNALLTALNERRFRNGDTEMSLPMKVFVGASNELPHPDDEAAPFWDRFLIRLVVEPIHERDGFLALLRESADPYRTVVDEELRLTDDEYAAVRKGRESVTMDDSVLDLIASIRASLSDRGVYVSDRRWKKLAGLLRTSALLHGRNEVAAIDCAMIRSIAWSTVDERPVVDEIVAGELAARSGRMQEAVRLEDELAALRREWRERSAERIVDDRPRPVLYRDEYYRILPLQDDDGTDRLVAWHGDVDELSSGPAEIDIFVYDESDQLVGSQRARAELSDGWEISLDGTPHRIETTVERVEVEETREVPEEERRTVIERANVLLDRVNSEIQTVVAEQEALGDEARAHLFVPLSDAEVVLHALGETATRLGRLQLRVAEFSDQPD